MDTNEFPANSLVATGQVTSTAHGPYISVWDSRPDPDLQRGTSRNGTSPLKQPKESVASEDSTISLPEIRRIELGKDYRGIGALAFSPDSKLLVAVALDNVHSVLIFDWRAGVAVSEGRGFAGEPPQVCRMARGSSICVFWLQ